MAGRYHRAACLPNPCLKPLANDCDPALTSRPCHSAQWVNYFWHFGHLHIKGLKMSKSLKNFITIREALERDSARQIRLMFLLQAWDKPMDYSDQTIDDAKSKEKRLESFFGMVKGLLRGAWLTKPTLWSPLERSLSDRLMALQVAIRPFPDASVRGCFLRGVR